MKLGKASAIQLREGCTGHAPEPSYLQADGDATPRFPLSGRSSFTDKPELDTLLAATKVEYNDHYYLPLTAETIDRLSSPWEDAKPIADMKMFDRVMINGAVNEVHADHVVTALELIGEHCEHLLVVGPIKTSELGNVFNREIGNISPGNDWTHVLNCFPNLKWLMFVHPGDVPFEVSSNTFTSLRAAIAARQVAQNLKRFESFGPIGLLTN